MKKLKILLVLFLIFNGILNINAQITGTVFRDGNGDGIFQTTEPKIGGVVINAYDSNGNLCGSAISSPNLSPNYTITGCSGSIRLEFIIPTGLSCGVNATFDFSTVRGAGSNTSVQFTSATSSGNDFGLLSNDFYVKDNNPFMFLPQYVNGYGTAGTSSGDGSALYTFLYNSSGIPALQGGSAPNPITLATNAQIGSTWGVAYSKQANRVFLASFLKRHVGIGPDGPGAIYMIDPANPPAVGTVPSFTSLDALGFATSGTGSYVATHPGYSPIIGTNIERGLPSNYLSPSTDASAFDQVGKVSLGDLDISDDGQYLFTINLFDRKLYRIDLQNASNPVVPTSSQVKQYNSVPWLGLLCSNGVARPFATKFYRGKIYVGVICTGENGTYPGGLVRYADDLRAYVYEIDPAGNGAGNIVFEFPLNYDKETNATGDGSPIHGWYKWTDSWSELSNPAYPSSSFFKSHPQPIFADIEFDSDGSMILSLVDRGGHQVGNANFDPNGGNNGGSGYSYISGGDILRTYKDPTTCQYILEANGVAGPYTSSSLAPIFVNNQWAGTGPSSPNGVGATFTGYYQVGTSGALVGDNQIGAGKEFYWGEYANLFGNDYPTPHHNEGIVGGLTILPSSGEVMAVGMDPVNNSAWSGGVYSLSNTTGARNNGYNIYTSSDGSNTTEGLFGKANGLGDIEITGEIPPIEIGNRVWNDTDGDGVQDASENPIQGVTVELVKSGSVIATAITDATGNYYFSSGAGTNTTSTIYNITQLMPNMQYIVRIPNVQGGSKQSALGTNNLTTANVGGSGQQDVRDSDGTLVGNNAEVTVQTTDIPIAGANNHTFDFGFGPYVCPPIQCGTTTVQKN